MGVVGVVMEGRKRKGRSAVVEMARLINVTLKVI
tara:strand:- start:19 stop:120 length:102 start_codon:yes stop_codon:yes gene_type:complete